MCCRRKDLHLARQPEGQRSPRGHVGRLADPLCDEAAIDDGVAHRLRSSAIPEAAGAASAARFALAIASHTTCGSGEAVGGRSGGRSCSCVCVSAGAANGSMPSSRGCTRALRRNARKHAEHSEVGRVRCEQRLDAGLSVGRGRTACPASRLRPEELRVSAEKLPRRTIVRNTQGPRRSPSTIVQRAAGPRSCRADA